MAWRSSSLSSSVPDRKPRRPRTYLPNFGFNPSASTRAAASSSRQRSNVYDAGAIRPTVSPGRRTRGLIGATGSDVAVAGFGFFFAEAAPAESSVPAAPAAVSRRNERRDFTGTNPIPGRISGHAKTAARPGSPRRASRRFTRVLARRLESRHPVRSNARLRGLDRSGRVGSDDVRRRPHPALLARRQTRREPHNRRPPRR